MSGRGRPSAHGKGLTPGGFSNASLALTLLAVFGVGALLVVRDLTPLSGAKPTGSPTPDVSVQPADESPANETHAATTGPPIGLTGVFPGPGVTTPPDTPVIPNVRVEDLAAAAAAAGMTCISEAGGAGRYPDFIEGYTLGCEGHDTEDQARLALSVTYWSLGGISAIYFSAVAAMGEVATPSTPLKIKVISTISRLVSSDDAKAWVLARLNDPDCRPNCTRTLGRVRIEVQVGDNGGRALYVVATAT